MVTGKCTDVFRGFFWFGGRVEGGGGLRGRIFQWRNVLLGEETFNGGGAGFSSIIKKNNEKINMKSFFY